MNSLKEQKHSQARTFLYDKESKYHLFSSWSEPFSNNEKPIILQYIIIISLISLTKPHEIEKFHGALSFMINKGEDRD
jgi:hypothetical protein